MIISEYLQEGTNKKCRPRILQIKCDNCSKEYKRNYTDQKRGFQKYDKDLCQSCKQLEQYKTGERSKKQCYEGGKASKKKMQGKSIQDLYPPEKCSEIQIKCSFRGIKNPMYGKNFHSRNLVQRNKSLKGKKFIEIYGNEKSEKIKEKISQKTAGKNNPMYGKPSPIGSGNGWSGWYKGWYFRSLHELSYMINVIERFNLEWKSADQKEFKIFYRDFNKIDKTYVADFIINKKYLVEIKPKKLHRSKIVLLKKEAAEKFCKERGFIYKLRDTKILSAKDINEFINSGQIEFLDRYKEKYKQLKIN
jgi:hypothetical protein